MTATLKKLLMDMLTGIDNQTFDAWRLAALLALFALIGNAAYANYQTNHFDAENFGIGAAAILGGAAWGIKQKKDTEPQSGRDEQ
jgi:hypothetical protein